MGGDRRGGEEGMEEGRRDNIMINHTLDENFTPLPPSHPHPLRLS